MQRATFLGLAVLLWCAGCVSQKHLEEPARMTAYEAGRPVFDLEASPEWRGEKGYVAVVLGMPRMSLIYKRHRPFFQASYRAVFLLHAVNQGRVVAETTFTDTLRVRTYEATRSNESVYRERSLQASPGDYVLEAIVTDEESGETVTRRHRVHLKSPEEGAALSAIHMSARRRSGRFEPILSSQVTSGLDSMRARVFLYHLRSIDTVRVGMRLLRFPRDTMAARPPYWATPSPNSLEYRGVRLDHPDTLQQTVRTIVRPEQQLEIDLQLPALRKGLYRLEARATTNQANSALQQNHTFTVRASSFPRITTIQQMTRALIYLLDNDEYDFLQASRGAAELRRRFDAFWGTAIPQRQRAADVIRRYFSRVEEANRHYTTYKEGWKTDRGMLFILLGPPKYVEKHGHSLVWNYSYNKRRDPLETYEFKEKPIYGDYYQFDHYILKRRAYYRRIWRRAIAKWRDGNVF